MNEPQRTLVQPMFEGPVDIVADVHGEIEALEHLLEHMGYDAGGEHPHGRRLVFLGDLVDRGPDSPGVLKLVRDMMQRGHAQCILGNHELNLLRGNRDPHNAWFRGRPWILDDGVEIPQNLLDQQEHEAMVNFMASLPIALERADLRAVHACWHEPSIEHLRSCSDALAGFNQARDEINARLERDAVSCKIERSLARQNHNPVKLVTSGPETRAPKPFMANGKLRNEARLPWWSYYADEPFCVFGHYWRIPIDGKPNDDSLFDPERLYDLLGDGNAMCLDYSVGGRYLARLAGQEEFHTRLCALRWPERVLVFDDGECAEPSSAIEAKQC